MLDLSCVMSMLEAQNQYIKCSQSFEWVSYIVMHKWGVDFKIGLEKYEIQTY
jgi:hypothetical protein